MRYVYVLIVAALLISPACVSRSNLKIQYDKGYSDANTECVQLQKKIGVHLVDLQAELEEKNSRLRSFNQLDSNDNLRYKKYRTSPCFQNPNDPDCFERIIGVDGKMPIYESKE